MVVFRLSTLRNCDIKNENYLEDCSQAKSTKGINSNE